MTADRVAAMKQRLRRSIFAACKRKGIRDEERQAIQQRVTGKASLTAMDAKDMRAVLHDLNGPRVKSRKPDKPEAPQSGAPTDLGIGPHAGKLRALWRSGWWLGVVKDDSDAALAAWICRQTGLDAARWMTPMHGAACVEALKDWLSRDGGVDWAPYTHLGNRKKRLVPGARVMEALWRQLHVAGAVPAGTADGLQMWVQGFRRAPEHYVTLPARTQNQLIQELGKWLKRTEEST